MGPMRSASPDMRWAEPRRLSRRTQIAVLTPVIAQLAGLVRARAPFVDGLRVAAEESPNRKVRAVLACVCDELEGGEPLHIAMLNAGNAFPRYFIDMVKVGEETGRLEECLGELEAALADEAHTRAELRGVLMYIGLAGSIILVVYAGLAAFVMPQYVQIYRELNAPARNMSLVSKIGTTVSPMMLPLAVLALGLYLLLRWNHGAARVREMRAHFMAPFFALPGLRNIVAKRDLAHAAGALHRMLRVGLPLHLALIDVSELGISPKFAAAFRRIAGRVEAGNSLVDAVDAEGAKMTRTFRTMVAIGEKSGLLPDALERVADVYREQAKRNVTTLVKVLEPCLVLVLGSIVYVVFSTMFLSISLLSDAVSGRHSVGW